MWLILSFSRIFLLVSNVYFSRRLISFSEASSPNLLVFGLTDPIKKKKNVKVLVAQSLCNPSLFADCSPSGSSVYGILQVRILD